MIKGSSNNVKGWKNRFFFILRDDWKFSPSMILGEEAPRIPRSWGTPAMSKRISLTKLAKKVEDKKVATSSSKEGIMPLPEAKKAKSFRSASRGTMRPVAPGEGTSKKPGEVLEAEASVMASASMAEKILAEISSSGRDNDTSKDGAVAALGDEAISKRISLTKLSKKVEDKKAATSSSKHVVIHENQPREETPNSLPNKEGKADDSKGKESMPPPEGKKAKSFRSASKGTMRLVALGEGTSKKPSEVLGAGVSVTASAFIVEKRVILPIDKEKGSSLAIRNRDIGNDTTFLIARVESAEMEMVQTQNQTIELEGLVVEFGEQEQKAFEDLAKLRDNQEAIVEKLAKSEMVVADLRSKEARTKELAVEEFKSSEDFQESIENAS
ncbi:hypothetical protein Acr_03g0013210 [Actinidia rufa]|uniref:Uncharacterized protein n=1 Tax=Actinidia rufa TaxID=165716 RepID=A0A7J0EG00_9ERIC|nr:hypothetical protein Acr_03g0013210 [Actinidia rufa]